MADPLEASGSGGEGQTLDFLGKPSPIAFKNQPALPAGSGPIGVAGGPKTTTGGVGAGSVGRARKPGEAPPTEEEIRQRLTEMGLSAGGGETGGAAAGESGLGGITGTDVGLMGQGISFLGSAPMAGLGLLGTAASLGGKALGPLGRALGINSDLTMNTENGPVSIANLGLSQGVLSSLMSALRGESQFAAVGPTGELSGVTSSAGQLGLSGIGGQAGGHGAQGGFTAPGPTYGGYAGKGFNFEDAPGQQGQQGAVPGAPGQAGTSAGPAGTGGSPGPSGATGGEGEGGDGGGPGGGDSGD